MPKLDENIPMTPLLGLSDTVIKGVGLFDLTTSRGTSAYANFKLSFREEEEAFSEESESAPWAEIEFSTEINDLISYGCSEEEAVLASEIAVKLTELIRLKLS